jgi:hypothetical protein
MQRRRTKTSNRLSAFLQIAGWTIFFLLAVDISVNLLFKRPQDPRLQPGTLAQYFEYGRSIQEKLHYILADNDGNASAVAIAGWLDKGCQRTIGTRAGKHIASFYGMSFSSHVGEALAKLDDSWHVELFAGPGAPPNHSYKCFGIQNEFSKTGKQDASEVQVLGILASSLKGMLSHTGASTGFESPAPYTYPRYTLGNGGQLIEAAPPVNSTDAWREALRSPAKLHLLKDYLSQHDEFHDPLLFDANFLDNSTTIRMLRRAYAQYRIREITEAASDPDGPIISQQVAPTLRAMIVDFAEKSKSAGKRPIVLLLQDKGSEKILFDILKDTLSKHSIDYLSTHDIVPSTDPSNFISDGHFTTAANFRIASALRNMMQSDQKRKML